MSSSGLCQQSESSFCMQLNDCHPAEAKSFNGSFLKYVMALLVSTVCDAPNRIFRNKPVFHGSGAYCWFNTMKGFASRCSSSSGIEVFQA
jgi:hypothetical protein